jgi:hypothetical protein
MLRGVLAAVLLLNLAVSALSAGRLDGFNLVEVPDHPFGGASAERSLADVYLIGATAVAIIPFFWQASPSSPDLARGTDMTDAQLRAAIRDAHRLGLTVLVKPHVWVPQSWAGTVAMNSEVTWKAWFANYQRALERIVFIAEEEQAEAVAIGTELDATAQRPEWRELIDTIRSRFSGRLLYVAHNVEGAETVPFWDRLDLIGVSLYPPLGNDDDRAYRLGVMRAVADRLDALAVLTGKSIVIGEVGLRSAQGAAAKPWESAEERAAAPDPALQAVVLADWLAILDRPLIKGVLIWRWLTDPDAGGIGDTDFTVQGKPAEVVLKCAWTPGCDAQQQRPAWLRTGARR